jgi:hypothetical protein
MASWATVKINEECALKKLLLLPVVILMGCMSTGDMQDLSSDHIGCSPNDITIEDPGSTSVTYNWTAICNGKTYICSQDLSGYNPTVSCAERDI